jgi:cell division protein FtsL
MRINRMKAVAVLIVLAMIAIFPLSVGASEMVTIEGEIQDNFQIVDSSGQIYEIADTIQGNTLAEEHIGEKAKVTGTPAQDQDVKIINITTFALITE